MLPRDPVTYIVHVMNVDKKISKAMLKLFPDYMYLLLTCACH